MSIAWRRTGGVLGTYDGRGVSSWSDEDEREGGVVLLALRSPNRTFWSVSEGSRESRLNSKSSSSLSIIYRYGPLRLYLLI